MITFLEAKRLYRMHQQICYLERAYAASGDEADYKALDDVERTFGESLARLSQGRVSYDPGEPDVGGRMLMGW